MARGNGETILTRDDFYPAIDYFCSALSLPKLAGEARNFLFRKFEPLTKSEGAEVLRRVSDVWAHNHIPRPADFAVHITDVIASRRVCRAEDVQIPPEDRPTAEDWADFDAKISKICKNKSIHLDEEEYDPIDAMAKWEQKRAKFHESIRIMEKIK